MTLLATDPTDLSSPSASPMALVSKRAARGAARVTASTTSSLFRPWAASEAAKAGESESASEASEALVQCSPPVGICAGLTSRAGRPAKSRTGSGTPTTATPESSSEASSGQQTQPILTRLEGLVATLDENSQSSRTSLTSSKGRSTSGSTCGSTSSGSCPPSPARDMRTSKNRGSSITSSSSSAGTGKSKASGSAFSGSKKMSVTPGPVPAAMLSLSPEEVALLAAQQQAFHDEALLAMAGLLPPPGAVPPPGMPPGAILPPEGLPAVYLDEYARLLQQEQKAQNMTARKQRPKKYRCPHCQVAFSNNGQLRGHVRIHTGERPFKCEEETCGKRFTRNEELTRHKRIHSGLRPFACQACGKRFGRKDHLKKHTRTHDPAHRMAHMIPMLPMQPHYLYGF